MANEIKFLYAKNQSGMTVDVFCPDGSVRQTGIALTENGGGGMYLGDCAGICSGDAVVIYQSGIYIGSGEYDDGIARKVLVNKAVQDKLTGAVSYYDDDDATVILTHTPAEDADSVERTVS